MVVKPLLQAQDFPRLAFDRRYIILKRRKMLPLLLLAILER